MEITNSEENKPFLKQIKDIKIQNGEWSIHRDLSELINRAKIEEQVKKLDYGGEGLKKDDEIEKAKLDPFILVFYYLIFQQKKIPTADFFFEEYMRWMNKTDVAKYKGKEDAIKARLLRTYPSLIRDIHFYYLLLESKKFTEVNYSIFADYYDGLDIEVVYNDKTYHLSIFTQTDRGQDYKDKKTLRHDYTNIEEIILKAKLKDLTEFGKIKLLGNNELEKLISELDELDKVDEVDESDKLDETDQLDELDKPNL